MSSSKNRQSTTSSATDARVGAEDGAIAIGSNSQIELHAVDGGAFELGEAALGFAGGVYDALRASTSQAQATTAGAVDALAALARTANEGPEGKVSSLTGLLIVAALGAFVILEVVRK